MAQEQCNIRKKSKQYRRRHGRRMPRNLEVVNPDAAGIDLGSAIHYVSVPDDRCEEPIRHFGCYTPDLQAMAKWLLECGVTTVVMESTGVYWTPVFRVLEQQGLEVLLVNPKHVKYVPGRKTDVADCQWLRQLHTFGLLKGAFVPPNEVAEMRALWRHRKNLVEHKSRTILQVQKVFTQMNIQLHVVLSDISGVSGMKIIRAILRGERDPNVLVGLVNKQVKATREEFVAALSGHYSDSQLFILGQLMAQYDSLQQQIQECDAQTEAYLSQFESKADVKSLGLHPKKSKRCKSRKNEPGFDLRTELFRITGVDFSRIDGVDCLTAFSVLSEIGFNVDAFRTEDHFVSWLGLCPNNQITGGKVKRRNTRKVVNRAATALRVAAQSLCRSNSYLGALYRRFAARLGPSKAITACAHRLARIIYRCIKYGYEYVDKGQQHLEQQHLERSLKSLKKLANKHGLILVNAETGECVSA
jgi:transposase